jgi:hypothetical protein
MRNCNRRTKLKKKTSIKEIRIKLKITKTRTKIDNQTTKRTMMYFSYQEREEKKR